MKQPKILIEMKHGLGDCVCMLPMLKILRKNYPDAQIDMLVNNQVNEQLICLSKINIDNFYYFSIKNMPSLYTIKLLARLRKEKYDYGILSFITPKLKGKLFFKLLGIKRKLGEQYLDSNMMILDSEYHAVERHIKIISSICQIPNIKIYPEIYVEPKNCIEYIKDLLPGKKIVGICIGQGDTSVYKGEKIYTRGWGDGKFAKLARLLCNKNYNVILFGGPQEKVLLDSFEGILGDRHVLNVVGKTNIVQSAELTSICDLMLGVDTGMQHIAAAVGVKTLSIFGPTNYHSHGAYSELAEFVEVSHRMDCQYCYPGEFFLSCQNRRCLEEIPVEAVFYRIEAILNERGKNND